MGGGGLEGKTGGETMDWTEGIHFLLDIEFFEGICDFLKLFEFTLVFCWRNQWKHENERFAQKTGFFFKQ